MSEGPPGLPADQDEIRRRYGEDAEREWNRLAGPAYRRLEFEATMHALRRYLPPSGLVLDAGGGPGRYARELCRAGYKVVLLDLAPALLEKARAVFEGEPSAVRDNLRQCAEGDIRDLSTFALRTFDATLCLGGPLSHIFGAAERAQAMAELVRVTKPGGLVVLSVVGYLAALRTLLWKFRGEHLLDEAYMQRLLDEGTGASWHFFRAEELRRLAEDHGVTTLEVAGCESLSTGLPEATNQLAEDEARWSRWQELVLRYATDPAVADMSEHILYVGRKDDEA